MLSSAPSAVVVVLLVLLLASTTTTTASVAARTRILAFSAAAAAAAPLRRRLCFRSSIMAPAASAASTRRHASSALRAAGPVAASSSATAGLLLPLRRSSRLLSTSSSDENNNNSSSSSKKKKAAKQRATKGGSSKQQAEEADAIEPPKKRGRPRNTSSAAAAADDDDDDDDDDDEVQAPIAASAGKQKPKGKKRGSVTTVVQFSAESMELVVEAQATKRPRRRTSKDSDVSDAPSDATTAATALLEEEEEEDEVDMEVAGPPSLDPSWEQRLEAKDGIEFVYGIDEAGRGPLAGPVVAAACYIPSHVVVPGIQDSKAMDEPAREAAYAALVAAEAQGVRWAVQVVDHRRIDEINILQATMEAMCGALATTLGRHGPTDAAASYALVDGNRVPADLPAPLAGADCVVKGDSKVRCIAAASILAKVTRDRIMMEYHAEFPQYDFAQHKGYPTPAHKAALLRHGPCRIHRMTFKPIKK